MQNYLDKASLGRTTQLGGIYDARSEKLLTGMNIFTRNLPKDVINVERNPSTHCDFINDHTISKKVQALKVDGDLSVSILSGLVKGSGAINYIDEKINTKEQIQCSFVQKFRTLDESINMNDERLKPFIARNIGAEGTHVVVGISWGAEATVTVTYNNSNVESNENISGRLEIFFKRFKINVHGNAEGSYDENDKEFSKKISIKVHADMPPTGYESPTTLEEIKCYINSISKKFGNANEKGKQLIFHLMPLIEIKKIFTLQTTIDNVLVNIESGILQRLESFFEEVSESEAIVEGLKYFIENNKEFIQKNEQKQIRKDIVEFKATVSTFRSDIAKLLFDIRAGLKEVIEIENFKNALEKNSSYLKFQEFDNFYEEIKEKTDFISGLNENNVSIVTKVTQLSNFKRDNCNKRKYMLFGSFKEDRLLPKWTENVDYFYRLVRDPIDKALCFVDKDMLFNPDIDTPLDIAKNEGLPDGIRVAEYFNGKYICEDCLQKQKKLSSKCLAVCENIIPYVTYPTNSNLQSIPIDLTCPLSLGYGKCSKGKREWFCSNCEQQIKYNFDEKFYCGCGFNSAQEFTFKCIDDNHGLYFEKFPTEYLDELVKELNKLSVDDEMETDFDKKELNILILGNSGVGKSTWINAIFNYLKFKDIQFAMKNEVKVKIPVKITVTVNDSKTRVIKIGEDKNEFNIDGASCTQEPKTYEVSTEKYRIRLIDTPGIGSTQGISKDEENMEKIKKHIAKYDCLHGICILMKPNETILNVMFRFCINELLTHLHKNAAENIVICFTNARSTFYKPGETLPILKKYFEMKVHIELNKNTVYCLDNEAFKFLCTLKHGIKYSKDDYKNYSESWDKSVKETKRLFDYFSNLIPIKNMF